jgi:hypothetical protein
MVNNELDKLISLLFYKLLKFFVIIFLIFLAIYFVV